MVQKKTLYAAIVMVSIAGVYNTGVSCPTCLAHLKRNDKPFFMREISAQIAAAQATVKTIKRDKSAKKIDQNHHQSKQ